MSLSRIALSGTETWNRWRAENPSLLPDLRGALLPNVKLRGARLHDAILTGADLSFADLQGADLSRADLRGALLTGADLRNADLRSAVLADVIGGLGNGIVDITDADFTGALFGWTMLGHIYLNRITGIGQIRHAGPSYISTSTLEFTAQEVAKSGVIRTDVETFLRGAGVLLDSLKQFEDSLRSHEFYSAFISYSHADKEFASRLHQKLESHGIRCWLDEKNMIPGERIVDALWKAITSHEKILLCCSRSSLESDWVQDEVRMVMDVERQSKTGLRTILILLDDYLTEGWNAGLAPDFRSRLNIDFKNWNSQDNWDTGMEKLLKGLRKKV